MDPEQHSPDGDSSTNGSPETPAWGSLILWPVRLAIAVVALLISFAVLLPALGGHVGLIAGALVCAAALAAEIAVTAKVRGEGYERTAARRILQVDQIMTPRDTPTPQGPERRELEDAEIVEAEVLEDPDQRPRLEP